MNASGRPQGNRVSLALRATIGIAVVLVLVASLNGTKTWLGESGAATTPGPSATVGTRLATDGSSHAMQQGLNGQRYPGGPSDEVSGAHDVPCAGGGECPPVDVYRASGRPSDQPLGATQ
jgi:hypothetical protein